jgi:uncharacterized membrane protein
VLAYPFIVLFGLQVLPLRFLGLFFVALAGLRLLLLRSQKQGNMLPRLLSLALLLVAAHALLANDAKWLRFYPVAVNTVMLCFFMVTLWKGPPLIERFARISNPDLPPAAVSYTRKVTLVWCIFFIGNGSMALYTALFSSFDVWAMYNGVVAYGLIGLLFGVEWLIRPRLKQAHDGAA